MDRTCLAAPQFLEVFVESSLMQTLLHVPTSAQATALHSMYPLMPQNPGTLECRWVISQVVRT